MYLCIHCLRYITKRIGILIEKIHEFDQSSWSDKCAVSYESMENFSGARLQASHDVFLFPDFFILLGKVLFQDLWMSCS